MQSQSKRQKLNYNKYTRLVILKIFASVLEKSFAMTTYREALEISKRNKTFRKLYFEYEYDILNSTEREKF